MEVNVLPPEKKEEPKTAEKGEKVEARENKPSIYQRFPQLKTKEMRREEMEKKKTLEELFEESESEKEEKTEKKGKKIKKDHKEREEPLHFF